jgi:hypothetical protein
MYRRLVYLILAMITLAGVAIGSPAVALSSHGPLPQKRRQASSETCDRTTTTFF